MISKTLIQIITGVVVIVFAVGIVLSGGDPSPEWLSYYSYAVVTVGVVLALWDRRFWRFELSQKLKATPIDLTGTWQGVLASEWIDPATSKRIPPKVAYLVVRQTASTIKVTLLTDESRSSSALASVTKYQDRMALDFMYLNEPRSSVNHRSDIHHGSTSLQISSRPASRLQGRYWTDRNTRGELDFTERSHTLADDYESALDLFKKKGVERSND